MSVLRDLGSRLLGANLLDWLAAGAGSGGTRTSTSQSAAIAPPRLSDEGETDAWTRTERDREIELRVLLSTWM
jgi:hypothetical protein